VVVLVLEKERDQEQEEHQGLERGSKRPRIGKRTSFKRPMITLQLQQPRPMTMLHHHRQPRNDRRAPALLPTLLLKRGAGKGKETV